MSEESTPPDLVELVRRFFGLLNRRAFDGFATVFTGDAVLDTSRLGLSTFEGVPAPIAFGEDWLGAYDEIEWTLEEALNLGSGVVLTVNLQNARPVGSSGYVRLRDSYVFICEEGMIVRLTSYH